MPTSAQFHAPSRLLTLDDVEQRTGYRKSKLYELMRDGAFPQPVRPSARSIRFVESEIDEWITARIAERDATIGALKPLLVTEKEIAAALKVSTSFLQKDRLAESPRVPFVRVGPHVRYDLAAVREAMGAAA